MAAQTQFTQGQTFYNPQTGQSQGIVNFDPNTGKQLGQGQTVNFNPNTPIISSTTLQGNGNSLQLPGQPAVTPVQPSVTALNTPLQLAGVGASVGAQEQSLSAAEKRYLELSNKLVGKSADTEQLYKQGDVAGQQKKINDLTLALTNTNNGFNRATGALMNGQVGTQELSGGLIARNQRQQAIEISAQSAVINTLRGNLTQVKEDIDHAIALKYDPIKQEIETTKSFIEMNYQNLTRADKKEADALNRRLDAQNKAIDREIRSREFNATLAASLLKDGKISNSQFSDIFSGSKTIGSALKDTGVNIAQIGSDPLETLTNVISSGGGKTDDKLKLTGSVVAGVQRLAKGNPTGDFAGFGPIRAGNLTVGKQGQFNRTYLSALEGSIESWMTGAAVSDDQAARIKRDMIPKVSDTDRQTRNKLNALANYMLDYASGNLATQGITYRPQQVDLFAPKVPGVSMYTPDAFLDQIPTSNTALTNEQFFVALPGGVQ